MSFEQNLLLNVRWYCDEDARRWAAQHGSLFWDSYSIIQVKVEVSYY